MLRVGVLGGTFDPVHVGHLLLAQYVMERLPLDRVLLVPAADPPHKDRRHNMAGAEHRWTMVQRAVAAFPGIGASRLELDRPGPSYTADTLQALRETRPDWALHLIIGADNVSQIAGWHEPERIFALCTVVAGSRQPRGEGPPAPQMDRVVRVETPFFEVSSTEIRARLSAGRPVRLLIPAAAEAHIRAHGLYSFPD